MQAVGLAIAVVKPRYARDPAHVMGTLEKTDALGTRMLAPFARVLHLHPESGRFFKPLLHHAALAQAMASVPSIGTAGEAVPMAELPEFGALDRRRIAPLVGVAPLNPDPGPLPGPRSIWDRHADVRRTLLMTTLTAVRHNAPLKTHC